MGCDEETHSGNGRNVFQGYSLVKFPCQMFLELDFL